MSKTLFDTSKELLIASAESLPPRIPVAYDMVVGMNQAWNLMTTDHEKALQNDATFNTDTVLRFQGAVEDGLRVAIFAGGQVIRQSLQQENDVPKEIVTTRITGIQPMLATIATQGSIGAYGLEARLGFRDGTFNDPAERLHIYGTTVSATSVDAITPPKGIVVPKAKPCPFTEYLADVMPPLAESLVKILVPEE